MFATETVIVIVALAGIVWMVRVSGVYVRSSVNALGVSGMLRVPSKLGEAQMLFAEWVEGRQAQLGEFGKVALLWALTVPFHC